MEAGCSGFSGNREGRCYKVIGVSVKCENKAAVTWAKKWLSIHGLESLIDRSKCQVKQLSQLIWILLKKGWKVTGEMGLLFWNIPRREDNITLLCSSVIVIDLPFFLVTFSRVSEGSFGNTAHQLPTWYGGLYSEGIVHLLRGTSPWSCSEFSVEGHGMALKQLIFWLI